MRYLAIAIVAGCFASPAGAFEAFVPSYGRTTQPIGHYALCQVNPTECRVNSRGSQPLHLTRELWVEIVEINNHVNTTVTPRTDVEIWGVDERWSYPINGVGDCEDYVLEKRQLLNQAGIPLANLLITVVRQPNGGGHAVLTVQTDLGDFVLDNLEPRALAWHETVYKFLKRQSNQHSGVWVRLEGHGQGTGRLNTAANE